MKVTVEGRVLNSCYSEEFYRKHFKDNRSRIPFNSYANHFKICSVCAEAVKALKLEKGGDLRDESLGRRWRIISDTLCTTK